MRCNFLELRKPEISVYGVNINGIRYVTKCLTGPSQYSPNEDMIKKLCMTLNFRECPRCDTFLKMHSADNNRTNATDMKSKQ